MLRSEDEEAGVDPAIEHGLFVELLDRAGAADVENAEARHGPHGGQRRLLAVRAVEGDDLVDVHIGKPVAVGEQEEYRPCRRIS